MTRREMIQTLLAAGAGSVVGGSMLLSGCRSSESEAASGEAAGEAAPAASAPDTTDSSPQETMRRREIPGTGEMLPVVGLGTWQQFDVGSDPSRRDPLKKVLQALIDAGGSVVDSSPMYGRAEAVVGELSRDLGITDQIFGATKVWTRGRSDGISQMEASIEKMNQAPMDLMQVHNLVDWRTHLDTLSEWKAEGRVRYTGVTHYVRSAFDDLAQVIRKRDVDFVQLPYSIRNRAAEDRLLPLAAENDVAVIVNQPYEGGSLFRAVGERPIPEWATSFADSWGQFFLKFILSHPAVTCVIPGTSDPEHMRDNAAAGTGPLPDTDTRERMAQTL